MDSFDESSSAAFDNSDSGYHGFRDRSRSQSRSGNDGKYSYGDTTGSTGAGSSTATGSSFTGGEAPSLLLDQTVVALQQLVRRGSAALLSGAEQIASCGVPPGDANSAGGGGSAWGALFEPQGEEGGGEAFEPSGLRTVLPRGSGRAPSRASASASEAVAGGGHRVTIGLCLSQAHPEMGHPSTVTRQTAFDFNDLQDRKYRYVSSTDEHGWRAGGGEKKGADKVATPDVVHIPILRLDCRTSEEVDQIVAILAKGDVFIPHMSVQPESLCVTSSSPPDLVVRFGCERNDDVPPHEWPNWGLEFVHNQLYEYLKPLGAKWEPRPFEITLARRVRWRTVKHMNKYFAHCERVINRWRERGPQYLDPQLQYVEADEVPEEMARPHGIYLLREGKEGEGHRATNYFAPNFHPPYGEKMTQSLLETVINRSWNKEKRDWASDPIPRLVTPMNFIDEVACGCGDSNQGRFLASQRQLSPVAQPYAPPRAHGAEESMNTEESGEYSEFERLRRAAQDSNLSDLPIADDSVMTGNISGFSVNTSGISKASSGSTQDQEGSFLSSRSGAVPRKMGPSQASAIATFIKRSGNSQQASGKHETRYPRMNNSPRLKDVEPGSKSVAESHTTVPINNKTSGKILEMERARQRQRKQERAADGAKVDAMSLTMARFNREQINEKEDDSPSSINKLQAKLQEREKDGRSAIMKQKRNAYTKKARAAKFVAETREDQEESPKVMNETQIKQNDGVRRNNSGDTFDYSIDGSSLLQGNQHAIASKDTSQQCYVSGEDSTSSSSLMPSQEYVPSDEELYTIGWAKALDKRSKAYYYFTLDRSQTIWENPLLNSDFIVANSSSQTTTYSSESQGYYR